MTAGTPNFTATITFTFFLKSSNLKILLSRCTIEVRLIAISTGKKNAKVGISKVPSPNPENRVNPDASNATAQMTRYSINIGKKPIDFQAAKS
jgi:hypothetical protein